MSQGAFLDQPDPPSQAVRRGPHWMAAAAAIFTLPLLYVGGSVTTYRVGLSVPDWPTTFGDNMLLYDFWNAPFGVRIEHAHRLYGAAVGCFTLLLAGWFLAFERRWPMKSLGLLAVVAVVVQGVLGGTRVTEVSTLLAAVHGCLGQAFFALMVALWVLTGPSWQDGTPPQTDAYHLRMIGVIVLVLVLLQIALGSWLRHYGTGPALGAHAVFALAVWAHALIFAVRVQRNRARLPRLVPSARALGIASTLQVGLGIASLICLLPFDGIPRPVTAIQAVARTAHQTTGAVLLASTVAINLLVFRHLLPSKFSGASVGEPGSAAPREPARLDWEAMA
jgi:cytochrome c oxidase assembly protein subunit 15